MSSPACALPLRLDYRPSRYLMLAVTGVHGAALLVLLPLPLAWWIKALIAAAVVAQGVAIWRRHVSLSAPSAVKCLVWAGDNRWELFGADGGSRDARLLPGAYVHPWLVVLRFITDEKRRRAVILPPDSLDPDSHRRLRVQLRLRAFEKG